MLTDFVEMMKFYFFLLFSMKQLSMKRPSFAPSVSLSWKTKILALILLFSSADIIHTFAQKSDETKNQQTEQQDQTKHIDIVDTLNTPGLKKSLTKLQEQVLWLQMETGKKITKKDFVTLIMDDKEIMQTIPHFQKQCPYEQYP